MDPSAATDDAALLRAARAGDPRALEALLARYQARVYRYSLRMCRNPADAGDVLQETLLALARSVRDLREGAALSTWLYTVARSHCIKARRQGKFAPQALEPLSTADALSDERPLPEEAAARREIERAIARALAGLSDEQREVVILRDGEGLSAPEVAAVLGIGVEAVKSRLHRARLGLREALWPLLGEGATGRGRGPACPDVLGSYSRLLEGEIDAATCREMERHLDGCPPCNELCDSLKRTLALCSTSPTPEIPAPLRTAIRTELDALLAARR